MDYFAHESVESALEELPLEAKIGQLFQVGFDGTTPTAALRDLLDRGVGSVIYFDRNVASGDQLGVLSERLQQRATDATGVGLLTAIDQEGGLVTRLGMAEAIPSPMAIAATGDRDLARRAGVVLGSHLREAGVTMNLAPVCDVAMEPTTHGIARSFGSDPEQVGERAAETVTGLQSSVVATAKHFPGAGDSPSDAHFSLPAIEHDRERLEAVELPPFEAAIDAGVDAIMVGHAAFPAVSDAETPGSIAPGVVTDLLRERLGYDGVVMTDCMEMDAIADTVGTAEGAVRAIEAGVDIVLISHTPERQRAAIDAVETAVSEGRLAESRIDESVRRVLSLKARRLPRDPTDESEPAIDRGELARRIAREAVTAVRDPNGRLGGTDAALVATASPEPLSPAEEAIGYAEQLLDALDDHGVSVRQTELDATSVPDTRDGESVVVCTHDAIRDDEQVAAVKTIEAAGMEPIVLAVHNPSDATVLPTETTVVTTYEYSPAMIAAAAAVVAGSLTPRGDLPVSLS